MQLDLITAFVAGLASFFAPCTFTTLPVFLTYISMSAGNKSKAIIRNISYYIAGFVLVFVLLGVGFAGISKQFISNKDLYIKIGGLFLVIMSLFILFGTRFKKLSFLFQNKKFTISVDRLGNNPLAPFLLGVTNAFSWSPCIGPILGSILFLASSHSQVWAGVLYLLVYAIGMTLPLLIFAAFFEKLLPKFHIVKKYAARIYYAGAVMILLIGISFLTGLYIPILNFMYQIFSFANSAS
jgi:cytochrome c-type biogenesis protein